MSNKAKLVIVGLVVVIAAFVVTFSFLSTSGQALQRVSDYQGALAEAKAQSMPVFVEFTSDT